MTTSIDDLAEEIIIDTEINYYNLPSTILDLSANISTRMKALELYYEEKGPETIEIISRLNGMYQMSGIFILEQFLCAIVQNEKIDILLRMEACKALLAYKELEDDIEKTDTDEEIKEKEASNHLVKDRNMKRKANSARALNEICSNSSSLPTPCRIEAIISLLELGGYPKEVDEYFITLVNDQNIECEFRYRTIISLENKALGYYKFVLNNYFDTKDFVKEIFNEYVSLIKKEFPDFTPDIENQKFFLLLISRMDYDFAKKMLHKHTDKKCLFESILFKLQLEFLKYESNMTYFKVLAGQYLLQKFTLTPFHRKEVEGILLDIAGDEELDYDRRADAADVLIQLGSPEMKQNGRDIIMLLGGVEGRVLTVFDNAQNVHNEEVEESVSEVLEFFATMPTKKVHNKTIDFDYIKEQVEDMLKKTKNHTEAHIFEEREKKIQVALSRIYLDRALYSKYNSTLSNILIKVWNYLTGHEYEEEMRKRLLEELEEMSGTCSTGFASRLINVISGFGEFNIRISWEDQITANFAGRLNAAARKITGVDGIFSNEKLEDVMKLWFNAKEQHDLKNRIIETLQTSEYITGNPSLTDVVDYYLLNDSEEKINTSVEYFAENVINEMALSSSYTHERLHFALFFRTYVAYIREEMYQEFKEHLDDTSFDLYMRKAMMHYDGV
jgi:hypothetical protein